MNHESIEDIHDHASGDQKKSGSTGLSLLTASVLASPAQVTEMLIGPDSPPRVHVPIPGWVWNLERRKQWQAALHHWRQIENVVIFVELPPASAPEAVLLAQNLPNLIWLADGTTANATQACKQLATLRHARCNLVGAVLNREPRTPLRKRFPRWFIPEDVLPQLSA